MRRERLMDQLPLEEFSQPKLSSEHNNPLEEFLLKENISKMGKKKKHQNQKITITIKCHIPDKKNPEKLVGLSHTKTCYSSDSIENVKREFLEDYPQIPVDREYYLGYNQLLFRFGTLDECGITQDKCIELYSPKKNAHVNHNEGVKCITWSIIPLVVGIASLIYTFTTTNVSNQYQALAMLIGLACVLPSLLCIFLGLILLPDFNMPCYFTGSQWF